MEIRQLEIFSCVAKKLSFSKAAEELYISQPTVSAQINSLEKMLNAQLLIRNTKGVCLTKVGEDFLTYAQKILTLRDQAVLSAGSDKHDMRGAIDIISSTIPAQHLLPGIISLFQKQWPNIVFHVDSADSAKVIAKMSSFKYDFGMIGTVPDDTFIGRCIYDDELVLVVPKDFSGKIEPTAESFAKYITSAPFIMRESGSGTRKEIESLFSKLGIHYESLHIPAYFSDAHSILLAVSEGMGISLVSKIAASMYVKTGMVTQFRINSELFIRKIYLIHQKELWLSPLQQAFADACTIR